MKSSRRTFIRTSLASATGLSALSIFPHDIFSRVHYNNSTPVEVILKPEKRPAPANSIRFSVIGLNHGHIYGMTDALLGGGGKLVSVYAREPELLAAFSKRYPNVKVAGSEEEILDDSSVQMVASASIPVDRASQIACRLRVALSDTREFGFQVLGCPLRDALGKPVGVLGEIDEVGEASQPRNRLTQLRRRADREERQ